jgi:C4-dicarboxylate-specific signal transduction histidine kinase
MPRVQVFGELLAGAIARDEALRGERDARAEAAHAARLGTMGVVAASLAHELTQPLAAIMSNAETAKALVAQEAVDREELRATIDDILADDRRAGTLIHQLRRFLRRDELDRASIDVRALLVEAMALVRGEAIGKDVTLDFDAPQALPCVTGNHSQVLQVALNLVLNAFDAVARNAPGNRRVTVSASGRANSVVVSVVDNGSGMDEPTQLRAFAPFYTTKPKGMGLGLSISRSIAESHGGSLSVRSAPGEGSEFCLTLPAAPP